ATHTHATHAAHHHRTPVPAIGVADQGHDQAGEHHHAHRSRHGAAAHHAAAHAAAHPAHAAHATTPAATHAAAHATHAHAAPLAHPPPPPSAAPAAHAPHHAHLAGGAHGDQAGGQDDVKLTLGAVGDRQRHAPVAAAFGVDRHGTIANGLEQIKGRDLILGAG